jgi:hypothetical protein
MTKFITRRLVNDLQQQTENFLHKAVSEWQMTAPSKMLQQPAENKWSAAQCLEHLNSYGHYYLPAIEKAIETAKQSQLAPKQTFTPGWLGDYFTKLMMPSGEGKKMKKMSAPKDHRPVANLDSDKVLSEFIDQQERILALLEQARTIDIEKARVPISIAKFIKLKLGDTFRFLIMHNYRHVLQAERALEREALALKEVENK